MYEFGMPWTTTSFTQPQIVQKYPLTFLNDGSAPLFIISCSANLSNSERDTPGFNFSKIIVKTSLNILPPLCMISISGFVFIRIIKNNREEILNQKSQASIKTNHNIMKNLAYGLISIYF